MCFGDFFSFRLFRFERVLLSSLLSFLFLGWGFGLLGNLEILVSLVSNSGKFCSIFFRNSREWFSENRFVLLFFFVFLCFVSFCFFDLFFGESFFLVEKFIFFDWLIFLGGKMFVTVELFCFMWENISFVSWRIFSYSSFFFIGLGS